MAITPRSFTLNPGLVAVLIVAAGLAAMALLCAGSTCPARQAAWTPPAECTTSEAPPAQWSEARWAHHVDCLLDRGDGEDAYRAAQQAVIVHPRSEWMLNLKGFVAGRNGEHSVASHDFATGKRVTGSPSGVFENNLAWSALWQLERLDDLRAERVLRQSRSLYEVSLDKSWSCERVHTGLFVEYALAEVKSRSTEAGRSHPEVRDAVRRYVDLYQQYEPCWNRIHGGDELVVEEILSAAVIDQEMGYIAGIRKPTRHVRHFDTALRVARHHEMSPGTLCEKSMPVESSRVACEALMR